MRCARIARWSGAYLPPRNPRTSTTAEECIFSTATRSRASSSPPRNLPPFQRSFHAGRPYRQELETSPENPPPPVVRRRPRALPKSAKLGALHARLSLPARFPLETLARCLTHQSADPRPDRNNASLALLGQELVAYYTAEWLICNYPRLPMPIIFAAQEAYSGDKTLSKLRQEWGVDAADAPGPEVDVGYLQFERMKPGNAMAPDGKQMLKDAREEIRPQGTGRKAEQFHHRRGLSSRIVFDDEFGNLRSGITIAPSAMKIGESVVEDLQQLPQGAATTTGVTLDQASASFIRAVFGALYLYSGATSMQSFHHAHILTRHLPLHKLFYFQNPTRDLRMLCDRYKLESPMARLISETGRWSRTPVFVVGVYSGRNKLGEDAGSSLNEGRTRAAAQALRSWYLYSPPADQICLPSRQPDLEKQGRKWTPQMIDQGEIIT